MRKFEPQFYVYNSIAAIRTGLFSLVGPYCSMTKQYHPWGQSARVDVYMPILRDQQEGQVVCATRYGIPGIYCFFPGSHEKSPWEPSLYIGVTWGPWITQREPTVSSGINSPQWDSASTPRDPTASRKISVRRQHSSREPTVPSGMIFPLAGSREYQPGPTASREMRRYPAERRQLAGIPNVFHGISPRNYHCNQRSWIPILKKVLRWDYYSIP